LNSWGPQIKRKTTRPQPPCSLVRRPQLSFWEKKANTTDPAGDVTAERPNSKCSTCKNLASYQHILSVVDLPCHFALGPRGHSIPGFGNFASALGNEHTQNEVGNTRAGRKGKVINNYLVYFVGRKKTESGVKYVREQKGKHRRLSGCGPFSTGGVGPGPWCSTSGQLGLWGCVGQGVLGRHREEARGLGTWFVAKGGGAEGLWAGVSQGAAV